MDKKTKDVVCQFGFPEARLITLDELENQYQGLLAAKQNRSRIEYYFTCTPHLLFFILNNFQDVDMITYLDADIYFFADPLPIYKEIGSHSIAVIEHRFSQKNKKNVMHGVYNVGWLSFRRDENSIACLNWWRQMCLTWCYDRIEAGRYADQKYLDDWPSRFNNVIVLQDKGANTAIWNMDNYKIYAINGVAYIDEQPLIFFHFHGLKNLMGRFYDTGAGFYNFRINSAMRNYIYKPYLKKLLDINKKLLNGFGINFKTTDMRGKKDTYLFKKLYNKIRHFLYIIYGIIIPRNYIRAPKI